MMSVPSISALTAGISLSACTQARTKKPMKPSLTPCFFSNRSRYWLRSAMTCVMSTSLKVVSMAAVFCASFSRRAMVWRSRVIRTRSSRAASSGGDGARACTAAADAATGVGCAAARSMAASMSPLVTRPSLPVPGTAEASTPVSAAILRTEGAKGASVAFRGTGGCAGACRGAIGSGPAPIGLVVSVFCSGRPVGTAPAPSLIEPSRAPTATVSPSLTATSARTPAAGAGTSMVTLSVSSSTSGSSTATTSPDFLNHLPMVASVTDSPRAGTRISAIGPFLIRTAPTTEAKNFFCLPLSVPRRPLSERVFEKLRLLGQMQRHLAHRCRRRSRSAGVTRAPVLGADLVQHPFQKDVDKDPAAHVARLFLAPNNLGLLETRQLEHQRLGRKRIKLLDTQQINVVEAAFFAFVEKIKIDLAGAYHDAANLLIGD